MKRGYNELVGLQATFSNELPRYRVTNIYKWKRGAKPKRVISMRGYSMVRETSIKELIRSLYNAYRPAIVAVWQQASTRNKAIYLQLDSESAPSDLDLHGEWSPWIQSW